MAASRPRFRLADVANRGLHDTLLVLAGVVLVGARLLGFSGAPLAIGLFVAAVLLGAPGLPRPGRIASYLFAFGVVGSFSLAFAVPGALRVVIAVSLVGLAVQLAVAWPLLHAIRVFNAGDRERSLRLASSLIARRPRSWRARQLRSAIHLSLGRFAEAEEDARLAVSLRPDSYRNLISLGDALSALGRLDEARTAFAEACQKGDASSYPHFKLGIHLVRTGDRSGAIPLLRAALRKGLPFASERLLAQHSLAACLDAAGDAEGAREARSLMPSDPIALADLEREATGHSTHPFAAALRSDIADIRESSSKRP